MLTLKLEKPLKGVQKRFESVVERKNTFEGSLSNDGTFIF
jgi:hypothetical protein